MRNHKAKAIAREFKTQATILGTFVASFWMIEIIDVRLVEVVK